MCSATSIRAPSARTWYLLPRTAVISRRKHARSRNHHRHGQQRGIASPSPIRAPALDIRLPWYRRVEASPPNVQLPSSSRECTSSFAEVAASPCITSPRILCSVTSSKNIVLRRVRGYRKFSDFDTWVDSTHQPGAPDKGLNTASETACHDNDSALSTAWHRFLGVDRQADEPVAPSSKNKRQMRESMSGLMVLLREKAVQVQDSRSEAVHKALQQVLGKQDVSFQSVEQEQALYAVLDNQTPLVVVLPTGGARACCLRCQLS